MDPYTDITIENFEKQIIKDFEYFRNIYNHTKNISVSKVQEQYLLYFIVNPNSSAYDIHHGKDMDENKYRRAKLNFRKLYELKLIVLNNTTKITNKHNSKPFSLTDYGIFYILKNNIYLERGLIEKLVKNYSNSNIFHYLLYPFIKFETICFSEIDFGFWIAISNYLINFCQKICNTIVVIENHIKDDKKIFSWNYSKLEDFLKNKYNYDWIKYPDFEEDLENENDEGMKIKYFDRRNENNSIEISFNKKLTKGYFYSKYNKIKKREIPLIQDYIHQKSVSKKISKAKYFSAWCEPNSQDFVLSVLSRYNRSFSQPSTLILLSKDERFQESLRFTKKRFDNLYKEIHSYTKF